MDQKETKEQEGHTQSTTPIRRRKIVKIKEGIHKLPDKKPTLDFIAAVLTIPLLAITLYLNVANLKGKNAVPTPTPTIAPTQATTINRPMNSVSEVTRVIVTTTPQPTNNTCIKDIGPIDISSPTEGQTVSDNPVCIDINYQAGNYCSIVWSYRINNGTWSGYSNNSVCLYSLPAGNNTFELRVKSLSSASTKTLHRNFIYQPSTSPTLTPTLTTAPTPTM